MNILIVDDHEIVRRGFGELLHEEFDELFIAEAGNWDDFVQTNAARRWDLIVLDIIVPGFDVTEAITEIRKGDLAVPILILTAVAEAEYAVHTLKAGANGYITKQYAAEELKRAVRALLAGEIYLSAEARAALAASLQSPSEQAPHETLSDREMEVFKMIARGRSIKQIAYDLSVSAKTVSTYITRIRTKTGLDSYVDITRYALQKGIVD